MMHKGWICIVLLVIALAVGGLGGYWLGWHNAPLQKWVDQINSRQGFQVINAEMPVEIVFESRQNVQLKVTKYAGTETVDFAIQTKIKLAVINFGDVNKVEYYEDFTPRDVTKNNKGETTITFLLDESIDSSDGIQVYYFEIYGYDSAGIKIAQTFLKYEHKLPLSPKRLKG